MTTLRNAVILFITTTLALIGLLAVTAQPAGAATGSTPLPFPQTNGVVMTGVMMQLPQQVLVIGGNFTSVTEPGGRVVAARNLAAIDVASNTVVYAGNVNAQVSYIRNVAAAWGKLYIAGNFTSVNGQPRPHIAQLDAYTRSLTSWKPAMDPGVINAVTVSTTAVFYGSATKLTAVRAENAAALWTLPVSQGAVKTLLLSPDESGLFVGGLFEKIGGYRQHGLVEIYPALQGTIYTPFAPVLLPDSETPVQPGNRQQWDGEEVLRLHWDYSQPELRLILCTGGGTINAVRSVNPSTGGGYWGTPTEGDVQGCAPVGDGTIIAGWHRNHGNTTTGLPYDIFGGQFSSVTGQLLGWKPRLSGDLTNNAAGDNGGVQDVIVTSDRVYLLGDFTTWGATCAYDTAASHGYFCDPTSGSPRKGIAVYPR